MLWRDVTIVLGIDQQTREQLALTLPNWVQQHPEMRQAYWQVFYDPRIGTAVEQRQWLRQSGLATVGLDGVRLAVTPWHGRGVGNYASQREYMLTGHVWHAALTHTQWSLKIDTDALCVEHKQWPLAEWFTAHRTHVVASGWNYTKAKGDGRTIQEWCETLERWGDLAWPGTARLGLAERIDGQRMNYPRFASWICWTRTTFARQVVRACREVCGEYLLPVPSHDTVLWYALERQHGPDGYVRAKQKRYGWTNISQTQKLAQRVAEVTQ